MLAPISENETTVYGFIRDEVIVAPEMDTQDRLQTNRRVLLGLPEFNACTLLYRDMFAIPNSSINAGGYYSAMMHFGAPYEGVEYEWEHWLEAFEDMLAKMYWVSAVVHLETPFAGTHTHIWEASESFHAPGSSELEMRCEWTKDKGFFRQLDHA
ncbi:MAG: hypothetical protein AB8B86_12940 [Pseudomonadales bacterium]